MSSRRSFCLMLCLAFTVDLLPASTSLAAQLSIGTGSLTGVYYPAGGAICRLLNKDQHGTGLRCTVQSTSGSIQNMQNLHDQKLDMAIVQSDIQLAAFKGTGEFATKGPDSELRSLFGLYTEPLTIVAKQEAGIHKLTDLVGKRVDIGNPGSGDRITMELLMSAMGWNHATFSSISELKGSERAQELCDNHTDAFIYVVGHPSGTINEASSSCDVNLVAVEGKEVDQLLANHPEYSKTTIPGNLYRGADQDTPSFGVSATLVTTSKLSDETAYQIVKSVFDNFEQFRRLHPAFSLLNKEQMVKQGLSAPLHPGALRYFMEQGLIKPAKADKPVSTKEKPKQIKNKSA